MKGDPRQHYKATTVYTAIMVTVIVILLIHGGHA
jgi:hypothetical protein